MPQQHPRKRFGQHFLHDPEVIERILAAIAPVRGQCLIEIGPGKGALTIPLLQHTGELHVVEIDRDLAADLVRQCHGIGTLHMHCRDALDLDPGQFTVNHKAVRVVGNLPYNISTPLLFHLLDISDRISDMVFMLQEEVVDRICAGPGTRTYGRLSVMVQARCLVDKLFTVGAESFTPPPKVASAVVKLVLRTRTGIQDHKILAEIVRQAFSQRRKTLRNALKGRINEPQMETLGIDPGSRPEQVTVEQYLQITNSVAGEW
ncbi:MAG: 16S rRNA (adenine(1518)-N(6)/adenine(1519)-N(6))-dimethyltransferase RsmA [Gammaproteobacteria bacterium]